MAPSIYAHPGVYEQAFSFRDVPAEVDAILKLTRPPVAGRILELAAGPAAHAIELARRGFDVTALDLSPAMARHAARRAGEARVALTVVTGDMREVAVPGRFDLVVTVAGGIGHLASEADLTRHFDSVAAHLAPGGRYLIETTRPGDRHTRDRWRLSRGGDRFDVRFGADRLTVRVRHADGRARTFSDRLGLRLWAGHELAAAARAGGLTVEQRRRSLAGQSRLVLVLGRQPD